LRGASCRVGLGFLGRFQVRQLTQNFDVVPVVVPVEQRKSARTSKVW
jgi:hypothetical protein